MKKNNVHTNDIKPDAIKTDVNRPDANKSDSVKPDAFKPGAVKPEENYTQFMEECVLPYILPRREECYLSRETGRQIYCAFYTAGECCPEQCTEADERDKNVSGIILIAHGFSETADKYFEVIYYFLKAGYHVCIPEHCGHGRTYRLIKEDPSLVHTDSWQRYVDDLGFIAESAKSHWRQKLPLFLFAHSMGGGIGAALAAQKPHLFDRVLLTSPMIRPLTGGVPWSVTRLIVSVMCALGREKSYVIGQHAYDGKETFEESCATSYARWDWYQNKIASEPLYQTCAASYGWLREAIRLNRFLIREAWKQTEVPVLLVQAEHDTAVSNKQQELFAEKLPASAGIVCIPGTKHEIFRSDDETVLRYMDRVLEFLSL
ncbi:MAG: alpha/beta hydrolase [Lachnospiraceae bacterium]|nr:alpha/beta hydrolase [Lachnospiraceae bacterium]